MSDESVKQHLESVVDDVLACGRGRAEAALHQMGDHPDVVDVWDTDGPLDMRNLHSWVEGPDAYHKIEYGRTSDGHATAALGVSIPKDDDRADELRERLESEYTTEPPTRNTVVSHD